MRLAAAIADGLLTDIVPGHTARQLRQRAAHRAATRTAVTARPVPAGA